MQNIIPIIDDPSLLYLDPPYVQKGPELYKNSFTGGDHNQLAESIKYYNNNWMVTYDANELVDELYAPSESWEITTGIIEIGYSAANTREVAAERLILSPSLKMPFNCR